jgi:alpha-amylase
MYRYWRYLAVTSLASLIPIAGCGGDQLTSGTGGAGASTSTGGGSSTGGGPSGNFVRIHYRVQSGGDARTWGAHVWGAGSTPTVWGTPQNFDKTDDFGAYTDVKVTVTDDSSDPDAWLGLIPVQCAQGDCKKDIQTSLRFFDLEKSTETPSIGECWITQGQAIQTKKPTTTGPAYKIYRPSDFIDLGNGSVRMMFRVAPGSTGTVQYGAAEGALSKQATWAATDDINTTGLIVTGLTPGAKTYYKITTSLTTADAKELKDETAVLDLTPIAFSTIVDESNWATWGSKGIMYQLIVRTFADGGQPKAAADPTKDSGIDTATKDGIGDLVGMKNMLPYLKDLGIDAVWMTPVFKAKSYHGYDTTDFYDIDPAVGSTKDFADLTTAAHAAGIKIILDLVQNHVADVNPWFVAGSNPKDPDFAKYHDWFVWSDEHSNMLADKHPWDASSPVWACKNYLCYNEIFSTSMPELNYHNPAVRAEMKKIADFWVKLGADGFRLDASKHIDQFDADHNIPLATHGTHVWWKEFNYHVKKEVTQAPGSLPVLLAGENRWDDPADSAQMTPYAGDMDSQFDFPFRSFIGNFAAGKTGADVDFVSYINKVQAATGVTANGGNTNHYLERFLSNHDLDRPATQLEGSAGPLDALLKEMATIIFTVPGMPVVYYGEELGKKGKRDKYLGTEPYDHDELIREPMSWFQKLTFTGDKMAAWDIDFAKTDTANASLMLGAGICKAPNADYPFIKYMSESEPASWAVQKDDATSLLSYYKKLIAIRKANAVMTDLDTQLATVENTSKTFEFTLSKGGKSVAVVLSRMSTAQMVTRAASAKDLLTDTTGTTFNLPPYGALILQ